MPERANDETSRERLEIELLVARCQLGEPAAFDALVAGWHAPLWRYVRTLTADAAMAEEVLQDGWLRILRGIDRLREPARLPAWLFAIVRRAFVDRLRRRYAEALFEPLEAEPSDEEPPPQLGWEESHSLYRALERLPPPDRETVVLFYLQQLELREVAAVLGVPAGTVKSRLHRARRLLRNELQPPGAAR